MKNITLLIAMCALIALFCGCTAGGAQVSVAPQQSEEQPAVSSPAAQAPQEAPQETELSPADVQEASPTVKPDVPELEQGIIAFDTGDYEKAMEIIAPIADTGDVVALSYLGRMYDEGKGTDQSYEKAAEYYKAAADGGNAYAQAALGRLYYYGRGVERDLIKAHELNLLAAEQGLDWAQYNVAGDFYYGEGTEKDMAEAKKWLERSAEQGYENAIEWLLEIG